MTKGSESLYQKLLFLDTNTMHYARLYLDFAQQRNLPPFGQHTGNPDKELKKVYKGRALDSFVRGRKIVSFLRKQCNSGVRIEYSPITRLELVCGLLRGRAIYSAAQEGAPHRMWGQMDEREILYRLSPDDYRAVQHNTEGIEDQFQDAGIPVSQTDPQRMPEVWHLAESVLGFVFLDVGDSVIYASALLSEADELVTSNGYLRFIVNAIENPGGVPEPERRRYFRQVHEQLVKLVEKTVDATASDKRLPVRLPKAPQIGGQE